MIRFVDLREQNVGHRFAYYNTVIDCFIELGGDQVWDSFDEVVTSIKLQRVVGFDLEARLKAITPAWAFEPMPEEEDS